MIISYKYIKKKAHKPIGDSVMNTSERIRKLMLMELIHTKPSLEKQLGIQTSYVPLKRKDNEYETKRDTSLRTNQ